MPPQLDSRFYSQATDRDGLLSTLDVDSLDEFETFLMYLLNRAMNVSELYDDEMVPQIFVHTFGDLASPYWQFEYPLSVAEVVRQCLSDAETAGPYEGDEAGMERNRRLGNADDVDLNKEMVKALGKTRIYALLETPNE